MKVETTSKVVFQSVTITVTLNTPQELIAWRKWTGAINECSTPGSMDIYLALKKIEKDYAGYLP